MTIKEKIINILLPYYDLFSAAEIATDILKRYKETKETKYYVKIGYSQELEIILKEK